MCTGTESREQQPYVNDPSARASRALGLFQGRRLKDGVLGGTGTHNLGTLLKSPQYPVVPPASASINAYLSAMLDKGHLFCCQMDTHVQISTSPLQLCGHRQGRLSPSLGLGCLSTRKSNAQLRLAGLVLTERGALREAFCMRLSEHESPPTHAQGEINPPEPARGWFQQKHLPRV